MFYIAHTPALPCRRAEGEPLPRYRVPGIGWVQADFHVPIEDDIHELIYDRRFDPRISILRRNEHNTFYGLDRRESTCILAEIASDLVICMRDVPIRRRDGRYEVDLPHSIGWVEIGDAQANPARLASWVARRHTRSHTQLGNMVDVLLWRSKSGLYKVLLVCTIAPPIRGVPPVSSTNMRVLPPEP
jgi:hypothetical protein